LQRTKVESILTVSLNVKVIGMKVLIDKMFQRVNTDFFLR